MSHTVYIVPRWSGNKHSDWYDWFDDQVSARFGATVTALDMPHWNAPAIEEATAFLVKQIPFLDESVLLVGHSVGCQAILRFLQKRKTENPAIRVGGVLLVAAWFGVDESWDTVMPWLDNENLDYPLLRDRISQKRVLVSDNDPFTSAYARNADLWRERLEAEVTICPQRAHFNQAIEPDVLAEFTLMMQAITG